MKRASLRLLFLVPEIPSSISPLAYLLAAFRLFEVHGHVTGARCRFGTKEFQIWWTLCRLLALKYSSWASIFAHMCWAVTNLAGS